MKIQLSLFGKKCTRCKCTKTYDCFSVRIKNKDGRHSLCEPCEQKEFEYRLRNKEKKKAYDSQWKPAHSKQRVEQVRQWRLRNPGGRNASDAKYRENNKEKISFSNKKWAYANKESIALKNANYRRSNLHKFRENASRRYAVKRKATPSWAIRKEIRKFYFAADFLSMVTGEWYEVDHIVPLQSKLVCGLHCEQNLQVIPASNNRRKSNSFWPDMP